MRILITGANSGLGKGFIPIIANHYSVLGINKTDCDIRDYQTLSKYFDHCKPDFCIHLASMTDIDKCEQDKPTAYDINVSGTDNIVKLCEKYNTHLIFTSSPFVFDGAKDTPYKESDKPNPINYYGQTKFLAENIIAESKINYTIVRLGWLFGPYIDRFSSKLIQSILKNEILNLTVDSKLSPLYTIDFADAIIEIINKRFEGILHIYNKGICSPYEFAMLIADNYNCQKPLPINFSELNYKSSRPQNFSISTESGFVLRNWEESLTRYLSKVKTTYPFWL